ncbi:MAG: DNA-binding protein [Sedimentibacter sp.]
MYKQIKTLIIVFNLIIAFPAVVNAEEVIDINNLIEHAADFDGQKVIVKGEAIGERMDRGNYSWVNINDGTNAIGIWLNKNEAEQIEYYGNYKYKGDTVTITGMFNRICNEHGGESDIHNYSLEITEEGHLVNEHISSTKLVIAAVLTIFALTLLIFFIKYLKLKSN